MNGYFVLKWLHVLSSTVLFGTGLGSAWYLLAAWRGRDVRVIAAVAQFVVVADWVFTATTVVIQPVTGALLLERLGFSLEQALSLFWVRWALILYVIAGAAWLPVVWIQYRMRDLARAAATAGEQLPPSFNRLLTAWVALGVVAFSAMIAVFWLMVAKPAA